jgi:tetratricopeptide (TPR) repeat protein
MSHLPETAPDASHPNAARLYAEARTRRTEGNTSGAFARYRRLLEMADSAGDRQWRADLASEIGAMHQDTFELLEARRWLTEALALWRDLVEERRAAETLLRLAQIDHLSGRVPEAEARYAEAEAALEAVGEAGLLAGARSGRGQLLCESGREQEGVAEMIRAVELLLPQDEEGAARVIERVRGWKQRVGPARYRQLVEGADPAADLRRRLLFG